MMNYNQLEAGLDAAANVIDVGGVIAVVTFHSLEDRIVKRKFNNFADVNDGKLGTSRYGPETLLSSEEKKKRRR